MTRVRKKLPPVVSFEVTARCNLNCGPCWGNRMPSEATTGQLLEIADQLAKEGAERVIISGGECLTRDDLPHILERLAERGVKVTLLSNGLLLPSRFPEVIPHIDWVGVSLDGNTKERNAVIRNDPEHFGQVLSALRLLRETNIQVRVQTLLTKVNFSYAVGVGDLLISLGLVPTIWKLKQFTASRGAAACSDQFGISDQIFQTICHQVEEAFLFEQMRISYTSSLDVTNHHLGVRQDGSVVIFGQGIREVGNIFALPPDFEGASYLNPVAQAVYDGEWRRINL